MWETILAGCGLLSVGSLFLLPWLVLRVPPDIFVRPGRPLSLAEKLWRNGLAIVLILVGLILLVLPGQGMVLIVAGVLTGTFRGRRRLALWLLQRTRLSKVLNAWRRRHGCAPFITVRPEPT